MHIKRAKYLANYLSARALLRLRAGQADCITAQDVIVADRRFREKKPAVPYDAESHLKISSKPIIPPELTMPYEDGVTIRPSVLIHLLNSDVASTDHDS